MTSPALRNHPWRNYRKPGADVWQRRPAGEIGLTNRAGARFRSTTRRLCPAPLLAPLLRSSSHHLIAYLRFAVHDVSGHERPFSLRSGLETSGLAGGVFRAQENARLRHVKAGGEIDQDKTVRLIDQGYFAYGYWLLCGAGGSSFWVWIKATATEGD